MNEMPNLLGRFQNKNEKELSPEQILQAANKKIDNALERQRDKFGENL